LSDFIIITLLLARSENGRVLFHNRFFHLSEPNLRDAPTQTGKIVMDICGIGVFFLSRSYFWGNAPQFFVKAKTRNFTMGPVGTFCFVFLIFRNPPMEIRENYWGYMSHGGFSLTHVLVFGRPSPIFTRGKKNSISGKIFDNIRNWRLTTLKLGEI